MEKGGGVEEVFGGGRTVEKKVELQLAICGGEQEVSSGRKMTREGGGGGDGGATVQRRRRRRLEDGGVAMTVEKNCGWGKEWHTVVVAAAVARRRAAAVGLLPRPSLSSHLRGRSLLSFFK